MKKTFFMALAVTGMMYSCGSSTTPEQFAKAANDTCACMETKAANREGKSADMAEAFITADYSDCAIKVLDMKIDVTSEDFTEAMETNCPDLTVIHKDYLKSIK